MKRNRWQVLPGIPEEHLQNITQKAGIKLSPLIVQLLYNRGIVTAEAIETFLATDERLQNDPSLLPDIDDAVARIKRALESGEKIAIYGDFDADGITATTILNEGLKAFGADVIPYIPHRGDEGYGLNNAAISYLAGEGITLLITADCGISAGPEIVEANRLGMDVVVTDHHNIPEEMPPAVAVIDPKRDDSRYPFNDLAGVGVAYKLLQALSGSTKCAKNVESFLDLVAVGTVADMVALLGENRYLVKRGLEILHKTKRVGIKELAKCAGIPVSGIDTEVISWVIAPRLNAAGRLDHAGIGLKLLSTDSVEEAQKLAELLEKKNSERQRLTEVLVAKAKEQIFKEDGKAPLIMVGGQDFHSGVVGVVAGKLAEEFYRPAVVFEQGSEWTKGSARSVPEVSIIEALSGCGDLLHRYGGHPMAAGFTIATDKLSELRMKLTEKIAEQADLLDVHPHIMVDVEVQLNDLQGNAFKMIQQLAPFGSANPYPVFLARGIAVEDCKCVGNSGDHLKFRLSDGSTRWDGIAFKKGKFLKDVSSRIDIVFNLQINEWRGRASLQLNIIDFLSSN
ncbi:MAG: single-stranded-DNA-specific exonuclease RecJ [Dehalococcoidia bacterium]